MLCLNNIDLNQNELLNSVIHKSTATTRPSSPVVGQITYDTDTFTLFSWNGTSWVSISDTDAILSIVGTFPIQASEDANRQVTISVADATGGATPTKGVIALGGDLNGPGTSATAPVVSGVGYGTPQATSAAQIYSAHQKSHDQNTDTGTTSNTFQIGSSSSGFVLKNVSGKAEFRNATDSDFADVKVKNLHVEGTLTYVHSTDVYIGDSFVTLNDQVQSSANNSNGGFEIKRLKADVSGTGTITGSGVNITGSGTNFLTALSVGDVLIFGSQRRTVVKINSDTSLEVSDAFDPQPSGSSYSYANQINPRIYFDDSANIWRLIDGTLSTQNTFPIVRKYAVDIGDGTTKDFTITHNLNTRDVTVAVRFAGGDYAAVMVDWKAASLNTITVHFNKAPSTNQFRVVITG